MARLPSGAVETKKPVRLNGLFTTFSFSLRYGGPFCAPGAVRTLAAHAYLIAPIIATE
jgi:hypothetical protein